MQAAHINAQATAAAWAKLWHLIPCILLVPDGRESRKQRYGDFAAGNWHVTLQHTLVFIDQRAVTPRTPQTKAAQRPRVARQPGGMRRVARAAYAGPNTSSPRTAATLAALQLKHPAGDPAAQLQAVEEAGHVTSQGHLTAAAAAVAAAAAAAAEEPQQEAPVAAAAAANSIGAIFTVQKLRATIAAANASTAAGPSGLSNSHLQQILYYGKEAKAQLLEDLTWLSNTMYSSAEELSDVFWQLHGAAKLGAVGDKARPIACGGTLRRLFARMYCRANAKRIAALLEPLGQFGVAVSGGVEKVALLGQLLHEAGGVLLMIDGRNAFNSVSRSAVLQQVAEHFPELYSYVTRLYGASAQPALLFGLEGQAAAAVIPSRQGVQQGDPLGPLLFSLALLPVQRAFKERFPELPAPSFLDDVTIGSLSGGPLAQDLQAVHEALCVV